MLHAAALVPPTALLVLPSTPEVFDAVRREARAVVARLLDSGAARLVVVVPASATRGGTDGPAPRESWPLHPTLSAAGVDDQSSGLVGVVVGRRQVIGRAEHEGTTPRTVDDVPAAVGLALLAEAGWTGGVEVVRAGGTDARALHALGQRLADDEVALLLIGGLSARRGPDAPLAEDPRAQAVDDVVAADLGRIGRPGDPLAQSRLAAVDPSLAEALAISAWGPWQVLLGALSTAGPALSGSVRVSVPAGATYATAAWERP